MTTPKPPLYCIECGHVGKETTGVEPVDRSWMLYFECNASHNQLWESKLPVSSQSDACRHFKEKVPCIFLGREQPRGTDRKWKCNGSILNARGVARCCTERCERYDAVRPAIELEKFAAMR